MRLFRHIRPSSRGFLLGRTAIACAMVLLVYVSDIPKQIPALSLSGVVQQVVPYAAMFQQEPKFEKSFELDATKYAQISQRFEERRAVVRDICKQLQRQLIRKCEIEDVKTNMKHVNGSDHQVVYCAIEKTGSTFWKRILHVVGGWGNSSNPMDILSKNADYKRGGFQTLENSDRNEIENIFDTSKSIMFVRDPYTRMFSGWLDKFYSTNPYYWNLLGRKIIKTMRHNATEKSRKCGHDVTFSEFVKFTVRQIKLHPCLDGHFSANFKHCMPCNFTFDYIGKYETLKEDTYFLIDKLNISNKISFNNFENDAVDDTIRDSADWVFAKKFEIAECMSFRCGLFRVWKRLQSRGIISKTDDFPYVSNEEANTTTLKEFKSKIKNAHERSDPSRINENRREALEVAFQSLTDSNLNNFQNALEIDFKMFGYDSDPANFKRSQSTKVIEEFLINCPFE